MEPMEILDVLRSIPGPCSCEVGGGLEKRGKLRLPRRVALCVRSVFPFLSIEKMPASEDTRDKTVSQICISSE